MNMIPNDGPSTLIPTRNVRLGISCLSVPPPGASPDVDFSREQPAGCAVLLYNFTLDAIQEQACSFHCRDEAQAFGNILS